MNLKELKCINENIDIDQYIEFRKIIKDSMNDPKWLGDLEKEDLKEMVNNNSKIWIYYLNNEPVCSMMLIPSDERSLSKFGIELDSKDVVDYGPMFVNPKFIGHGLQYQMLEELDKYCTNLGYKYAIGTIHPDNIYSIRNLVKDGFEYQSTKEFKRGTRNVYMKKYK